MWDRRNRTVVCIACGDTLSRADAREYDKHGDRWDRRDKEFEYLCKPCYRELCHQPRNGLETLLVEMELEFEELGSRSRHRFVERYYEAVETSLGAEESDNRRRKR